MQRPENIQLRHVAEQFDAGPGCYPNCVLCYVEKLENCVKELENQNDSEWDATDAAHPAWWRGNDYAYEMVCAKIHKVLAGEDKGEGAFGGKELEDIRRRILKLMNR
jgi:hypothetical protein